MFSGGVMLLKVCCILFYSKPLFRCLPRRMCNRCFLLRVDVVLCVAPTIDVSFDAFA